MTRLSGRARHKGATTKERAMQAIRDSKTRIYSKTELTGLFQTYFGDKLTQAQLESLIESVLAAHADAQAVPRPTRVRDFFSGSAFAPAV
jgi:hypothetical protein